uniref:BTB domain-containing protein n=1 Tax=Panagrellus redivivus TaxID=6233 RepID=A0A7E4VGI9_PANRE
MPAVVGTVNVEDSCTIVIKENELTERSVLESQESPKRNVPCSSGVQWNFRWYPAGDTPANKDNVTVCIYVDGFINFNVTVTIEGNLIKHRLDPFGSWYRKIKWVHVSHHDLQPFFCDGKVSLTYKLSFEVEVPVSLINHSIFQSCEGIPTDCEIVVGTDSVKAHKNLLQFIAPGLYANFIHNTVESRSGKVIITDFDYKIVKATMDYLYGCQLEDVSIETVIGMLRFADKYNIKSVQLEKVPFLNLKNETFYIIVHYAFDCCKDSLFNDCVKVFKRREDQLKTTDKFAKLPPAVVVKILKSAFSLSDTCEILRHAHNYGFPGVIEYLEFPMSLSLSLQNFCDTASYAWDHSREELKKTCAKFFYDNRLEITIMPAFHELGNTAVEIMKASLVSK